MTGLALIHQIQGENVEARRMVEGISQYDLEQSGSEDEWTWSLRARLMLLQDALAGVLNSLYELHPTIISVERLDK